MEDFATAFDRILTARSIEQLEVATAAGMSEAAISLYRRGLRIPAPERIERLAAALDMDPAYFKEWRRWRLHLTTWTEQGKAGEMPARYRRVRSLPWLEPWADIAQG